MTTTGPHSDGAYEVRAGVPEIDVCRHLRAATGLGAKPVAAAAARHLYAKFGFTETAPASVGMHRLV